MAQPFVGEIRMFGGNFPPVGWMFCDGQTLPISENDVLFTLIGTTYGGDGQETFNLPNLQSRIPIHFGTGPDGVTYQLAEASGVEQVTLTTQQIPGHSHPLLGSTSLSDDPSPAGKLLGESRPGTLSFFQDVAANPMAATAIAPVGGSQPHENCQPFLCVNFIISLFGIFPTQT
jgi:microcystin-dependent protein